MELILIIVIILSYIIGSIPWAYIIVKLFYSEDLRKKGTGNIGAMNSYEITGKKWIGIAVFILDCIKGIAAVLLARLISNDNIIDVSASGFFVILGHNFSVFLKFKGGRGLSSAVGVSLMINPWLLLCWTLFWFIEFQFIKKDIHIANISASILTPAILLIIPEKLIMYLGIIPGFTKDILLLLTIAICLLILIRHLKPIKELINKV
ncbi:MAG: glycerol-3-phosphate acyltransferase [Ignavibacteriae bacterium]|nr:glycerol-3-phosphate acyltransferase [Ignavibacteriota bacterium]